jgi:hypothetical protein
MTTGTRRTAILSLIKRHTAAHSRSRDAAREALVKEGIYTPDGKLEIEYGGDDKK